MSDGEWNHESRECIENNGGVVVCYENCSGYKNFDRLVDAEADDIIGAIADRYLKIGCSVIDSK